MNKLTLKVSKETFKTIENISQGVFSPLGGFLCREDFESVLKRGRLKNGSPWTIPIVFDIEEGQLKPGQKITLAWRDGSALFSIGGVFPYSKNQYAKSVFGTLDEKHPGVQKIKKMKDFLAGGKIALIKKSSDDLGDFITFPNQTKEIFKKRGWKTVAAFQTRNVPHIGHEYLQKIALNLCDGVFINPVIGKKKPGDFKDNLIKKTYKILAEHYFPKEKVVVAGVNYEMQYAGPKEAIHHAIIRKNFGCTHFIVGRDHAGVGNYYHPFAAQEIFKKYPDLGIVPLFLSSFFHCEKCKGIASENTCPHTKERVEFKGTALREMLMKKEGVPENLMRPEVVEIIKKYKNPFTS